MPVGAEVAVRIAGVARVVTESSVWLLREAAYVRLPRREEPRRPIVTPDDALTDGRWVEHREVLLVGRADGVHLRIVPADRPPDAQGVITGVIVVSDPPLEELVDGAWSGG